MSQWGEERIFTKDRLRVIPHLKTQTFDPANSGSIIDDLLVFAVSYDFDLAGLYDIECALVAEWVGRPYSDWLALPKENDHGI